MKKIFLSLILIVLIGFFPVARETVKASDSITTGWCKEGDTWYYRDSNGELCYGWRYIGVKWYYFDLEHAYMYADGWRYVAEEGKEYYFTSSGDAYTGWYLDEALNEKFYFTKGQYNNGWLSIDSNWYYFDNGRMVYDKDIYYINGLQYGFKENGVMRKNWYEKRTTQADGSIDVDWYYYDAYGQAANGWNTLGGIPYYFIDGWMVDDGVRYTGEDGIAYGFNDNGTKKTSTWYLDPWYNEWFYFDADGSGHNGWLGSGTKYYCVNGKMLHDCWYQTGPNEYSQFNSNGVWIGTSTSPGQ